MRRLILLTTFLTYFPAFAHEGPFFSLEHIDTVFWLAAGIVFAALGCILILSRKRKAGWEDRTDRLQ